MVRTSHHRRQSRVSRRRGVSRTRRSRAKTIRGGARRSKRAEKHTRGGVDYKKIAALGTTAVVAGLGLRPLTRRTTMPKDLATMPEDPATMPEDLATMPEDPATMPEDPATMPKDPATMPKDLATTPEALLVERLRLLCDSDDPATLEQLYHFLKSVLVAFQPCEKEDNKDGEIVQLLMDATRTKVNSNSPSPEQDYYLTALEVWEKYYELLTAFRKRGTSAVRPQDVHELKILMSNTEEKLKDVTPQIVFTVKYLDKQKRTHTNANKVQSLKDCSQTLKEVLDALPPCKNASQRYQDLIKDVLSACAAVSVRLNPVQTFSWEKTVEGDITTQIQNDEILIKSFDLETLYNLDPCAQIKGTVDALITSFTDGFKRVTSITVNDQATISRYSKYLDNLGRFLDKRESEGKPPRSLNDCENALRTLQSLQTEQDRTNFKTKIEEMWKALLSVSSSRNCNSDLVKLVLRRVTDAEAHLDTETHNAETRGR